MTARLELLVAGRVQGVGFRAWARSAAVPLGLAGRATNLPDGRVEVIAEGDRSACERLVAAVRGDDPPGYVSDVFVRWTDPQGELGFATH